MEATPFNASVRTGTGKGAARKLRASGRIPATVYGGGKAPVSLDLDPRDVRLRDVTAHNRVHALTNVDPRVARVIGLAVFE